MQTSESINQRSGSKSGKFGVVVIGRNEGQRLITCLRSMSTAAMVVYVDSNSTDGSVQAAQELGADVVELDLSIPFTAARARNAGFSRLLTIGPDLSYIQFVDGDCELAAGWPNAATAFLDRQTDVAAVCGRLRERYPDQSVYNWLCDIEWDRPTGEVRAFAGNVMVRAQVLKAVGGYREDVIAAEEDELCVRLRQANWRIWRLADEMALHDAAMLHFGQWWKRARRAGYAFAQGSHLHGSLPERHFVREARRAMVWGLLLPLICFLAMIAFPRFGWIAWLVYPMQFARLSINNPGSLADRVRLAFFQILARFPEGLGLAGFWRNRLLHRRPELIEHKQITRSRNA
ncbi:MULTISPECIES: glycosyltransferase [Bradyrhizobium]|uniref:Glycosyl transferase family 2 n=2 Tax=Bradyrhizobium TaxID=374 RepID=A0ABY0Q776_9BRAD|nr:MULTISPECIES: glycosyltransferase [Bradyrhizobium]SDJ63992.1 Glycosyl transferase family 2 [Bradyrhizobium ottawaense]SEC32619.1 Glycosyl transferase family 2 [Bradyrhizobium lablabi]